MNLTIAREAACKRFMDAYGCVSQLSPNRSLSIPDVSLFTLCRTFLAHQPGLKFGVSNMQHVMEIDYNRHNKTIVVDTRSRLHRLSEQSCKVNCVRPALTVPGYVNTMTLLGTILTKSR